MNKSSKKSKMFLVLGSNSIGWTPFDLLLMRSHLCCRFGHLFDGESQAYKYLTFPEDPLQPPPDMVITYIHSCSCKLVYALHPVNLTSPQGTVMER